MTKIILLIKLYFDKIIKEYTINNDSYTIIGKDKIYLIKTLKKYGLYKLMSHDKFIPDSYLYNTIEIRLKILQGLMDTDGSIDKRSKILFGTTSKKLSENVRFLVESLGGTCNITTRIPHYTYKNKRLKGRLFYSCWVHFHDDKLLFNIPYKKERIRQKPLTARVIRKIEFSRKAKAQCMMINHSDELYLTNNFIVTHNTFLIRAIADRVHKVGYCCIFLTDVKDEFKCLFIDTLVYTLNGIKSLKELNEKKDLILSYNFKTKKKEYCKFKKSNIKIKEVYEIELENGEKIICTKDHKFFTETGEKKLSELKENDEIYKI
jgi:intein/homing endonuclease